MLARSGPRRCIAELHMREATMQHGHTEQAYLLYKSAMYSRHVERGFFFSFFPFLFFPPRFIGHLIKQELLICDAGAASFHECENPHFNPRPTTRSSVALTLYRDRCITLRIIITCTCVNNDNSPVSSVPSLNCDVSFEYPPSRL